MLVLERKVGQKIRLSDGVTITVLELGHNTVRLGFESEDETLGIWRSELIPEDKPAPPARKKGAADGR